MHHYMCLSEKVLHSISDLELPLELLAVEDMAKFGYHIISTDGDEITMPVLHDGKVMFMPIAAHHSMSTNVRHFCIIQGDPHMHNGVTPAELELIAWLQGLTV